MMTAPAAPRPSRYGTSRTVPDPGARRITYRPATAEELLLSTVSPVDCRFAVADRLPRPELPFEDAVGHTLDLHHVTGAMLDAARLVHGRFLRQPTGERLAVLGARVTVDSPAFWRPSGRPESATMEVRVRGSRTRGFSRLRCDASLLVNGVPYATGWLLVSAGAAPAGGTAADGHPPTATDGTTADGNRPITMGGHPPTSVPGTTAHAHPPTATPGTTTGAGPSPVTPGPAPHRLSPAAVGRLDARSVLLADPGFTPDGLTAVIAPDPAHPVFGAAAADRTALVTEAARQAAMLTAEACHGFVPTYAVPTQWHLRSPESAGHAAPSSCATVSGPVFRDVHGRPAATVEVRLLRHTFLVGTATVTVTQDC